MDEVPGVVERKYDMFSVAILAFTAGVIFGSLIC